MRNTLNKTAISVLLLTLLACNDDSTTSETEDNSGDEGNIEVPINEFITFITIPQSENISTFEMADTEVTNGQYAQFLNEALTAGKITYDNASQIVFNLDGKQMIALAGSRVVSDHNKDGTFSLDEMENPLNRCFIEFNETTGEFNVVDPDAVDWNKYFDPNLYPNVVDSVADWAELNDEKTGGFSTWDQDKALPTLAEVNDWPVGFVRWYGANGFAKFYGYDLPEQAQWKLAAKAGEQFTFATSDGSISAQTAIYNDLGVGIKNKGHVQGVKSIPANPLGLYSMGGNTWEWCKDWFKPFSGNEFPLNNTDGEFFIDDSITDNRIDTSQPVSLTNQMRKAGIGGSWNYFDLLMSTDRNGLTPFMEVANDHFGFRVVKNSALRLVNIPTSDDIPSFNMSETEVTNEQYKNYLNEAYAQGLVTMMPSRVPYYTVGDYSDENMVFDTATGNPLVYLGGSRVIKDHNKNGTYEVREMENPLNRSYIRFNTEQDTFEIVDPSTVEWSQYFDQSIYPDVVDSIDDWAELNTANNGRIAYGDLDQKLPTKDEVKNWPVTFVRYFGADSFAKFYGYDIPTQTQWKLAAQSGLAYFTSTNNGEAGDAGSTSDGTDYGTNESTINAWFDSSNGAWMFGNAPVPATHVQSVKRLRPNTYGLYSMGGNVWEWTVDWYEPDPNLPADPFGNRTGMMFVDGEDGREPITLDDIRIDKNQPLGQNNQYMKSAMGGAHNFPDMSMNIQSINPHPFLAEANDHFGFRIVEN